MSVQSAILPTGFEDLVDLYERWARPTENLRSEIRWKASAQDFRALYEAMLPRLPDVLSALAACPLEGMNPAEEALFNLAVAFAEAAPHHELYSGSAEVPFSFAAHRFRPGHGDLPANARVLR